MLTLCALLQSDSFWLRIRTHLYLKMHPLVLSKAIELSLVTLWQVGTCSMAVCLSLPSHSWFLSYRVSLVFFVGPRTLFLWMCTCVCVRVTHLIKTKTAPLQYVCQTFIFIYTWGHNLLICSPQELCIIHSSITVVIAMCCLQQLPSIVQSGWTDRCCLCSRGGCLVTSGLISLGCYVEYNVIVGLNQTDGCFLHIVWVMVENELDKKN
jgi:hypothetical protein